MQMFGKSSNFKGGKKKYNINCSQRKNNNNNKRNPRCLVFHLPWGAAADFTLILAAIALS